MINHLLLAVYMVVELEILHSSHDFIGDGQIKEGRQQTAKSLQTHSSLHPWTYEVKTEIKKNFKTHIGNILTNKSMQGHSALKPAVFGLELANPKFQVYVGIP